jgi:hypothetical protein
MPTDLFRPVIQVIVADPPDREGKSPDTYKSSDVPAGHRAPTARLLRKFSTAAGLAFHDEHRLDDGSDPDILGVTMNVSMVLPTGQRITAPGSQLINLRTWFKADASPAEVAKFRKQFYANVQTRAMNRGIRGVLSLRSSYPEAELAKPFAVVSYTPNMNHPEVRARILDAMVPVAAQLYGASAPAAKQLAAGDPVIEAPEAPEEDPAPATITTLPGEKLAKVEAEEPDWISGAGTADVDVATVLRDSAAISGMQGPATPPQLARLKELLYFDGAPKGIALPALGYLWGDEAKRGLSAAQVQALLGYAESVGQDAFVEQIVELAGRAGKAAA